MSQLFQSQQGASKRLRISMAIGALSLILVAPSPAPAASPPAKVDFKKVTVGVPSIWSLEQAHYLLSRVHAANEGLNGKAPSESDLDPNATNASRVEVLRTMLGVAAEFDETASIENRQTLNEHRTSVARRTELRSRLDQLRVQRVDAVSRLGRLRIERELLNATSTATDADKRLKDAEIAAVTAEKELLDSEITSLETELAGLSTALSLTATTPAFEGDSGLAPPPDPALTQELVSQALTAAGTASPRLHVSTVLDNHVQLQYELIAKQLTLLRDELGPDRRLLFLELPVSIYTQPRQDKKRVAQVRWKVTHVCRDGEISQIAQKAAYDRADKQQLEEEELRQLATSRTAEPRSQPPQSPIPSSECTNGPINCKPPEVPPNSEDLIKACNERNAWDEVADEKEKWKWDSPRVVDLIPRRSALNVNQVYNETRGLSLGARFAGAFGLGAAVRYQRQRELFEQYMHQDVFASGFGKGQAEFGWVFGPEPGTELVAPGVRTTYAALVVPRDVKAFKLEGMTFLYKHKKMPDREDWIETREAQIAVPNAEDGFHVSAIDYTPVAPGERVTVLLEGMRDFSPQIGVLVNGVPLRRAVAIARPGFVEFALAPSVAGSIEVNGEYELVNSRRLVLSFSMGERFVGTPVITLVTPTKATSINTYQLTVNGDRLQTSLYYRSQVEPMFLPRLAVGELQSLPVGGGFNALLVGQGFRPGARIFVDGQRALRAQQVSTKVYRLQLRRAAGNASEVEIRIRQRVGQGSEEVAVRLPNPRVPRLVRSEILSCGVANARRCGTMTAKLELTGGTGTGAGINVIVDSGGTGRAMSLSDTERLLRLTNVTDDVVVLRLDDRGLQSAATLVVPEPPTIRSVVAAPTSASKGPSAGNYLVHLQGRSLERVTRVLFGDKPALIQRAGPGEVVVIAPAGTNKTNVPVRVATDVVFLGRVLDNELDFNGANGPSFSYEDPPPPKPAQ